MAKKVQLMTNPKEWQTINGVEVLVDVPQEDLDPITDSSCVEIEGHRTLEETINQENMFTPEIVETKVSSKVGGVYHDNIVDGAYEEAILYGNTQVNLVTSPTREGKYIPQTFTSFQGDEGVVGAYVQDRTNQVAPLVKGVTMVNLCQVASATLSCQHTIAVANHNAKPNTKYTLKCKFTEKNKNAGIMVQSYGYKDGKWGYIEISKTIQNLGDDVLLTFTTHEQADSIIIYNNPAFCEDTNDSITLDDIMVIEGDVTDLDLPFFKGMRSVELSRPLTNLLHDDIYKTYGSTTQLSYSNGNATVTANAIGTWQSANFHFINEDKLKPNTKYIVMWDSLTQTQTSTSSGSIIAVYDTKSGDGNINIGTANSKSECPVLRSIVFDTTGRDASGIVLRIHATLSNSETGTTTVTGLRVFEWDDSLRSVDLQSLGYFSGTKYVSASRPIQTTTKNLYPYGEISYTSHLTNNGVWFDSKGTSHIHGDVAQKSKARFLLKKGTYTITTGVWVNIDACQIIDDKEQIVVKLDSGKRNHTFTLLQDTYCTLRFKVTEIEVWANIKNIQIERGETATTYSTHNGRYYQPRETEEIILRSLPNGVCDTFNLQTGELVQRIGEVMLNGSEDEDWLRLDFSGESSTNGIADTYICYGLLLKDKGRLTKNMLLYGAERHVIDTLNISSVYGDTCNQADISTEMVCIHQNGRFYLRLRKDRFSSTDLAGWKLWFSQNPITVQYELKEPIIRKIQTTDRVYNGQTNAKASMGNNLSALTYYSADTKIKLNNLSPIPAIVEPITILPCDVRLKPNTTYTVKYLSDHSTSAKINLGGTEVVLNPVTSSYTDEIETLVKTPVILEHEQILMGGDGRAYQVIVVEGDITGTKLPYFQGMKDVKMPIVKNTGKNLFHGGFELGTMSSATGQLTDSLNGIRGLEYIRIISGKTYTTVCDDPTYKFAYVCYDKDKTFLRTSGAYANGETYKPQGDVHYVIMRTPNNATPIMNNPHVKLALYEHEEGMDKTLQDYKENSIYAVQGEIPITNEMVEQGGFSTGNPNSDGSYETTKYGAENANYLKRLRSKDLIPVKPNTTYAFAHSFPKFAYNVYQWNGNKEFIDGTSRYFAYGQVETITTTADTQYIHFLMSKHETSQTITVAEYDWSQFHIYELDSTINLRSLPNGVKDELNLLTGEYIQRVGEVVLNGKNNQFIGALKEQKGDYLKFGMQLNPVAPFKHNVYILNDRFNSETYSTSKEGQQEQFYIHAHSSTNTELRVCILPSRLSTPDEVGFNSYLQSNPITVQYELAEPIISHVRLISNNQEREVGVKLPNGVCNTYNPSTGITTVRVGKVVLDGSEQFNGPYTAGATVQGMYYYSYDLAVKRNTTSKQLTTISSGGMKSIPFASLWLLEQEGVSSSNSEGLGLRFATKCATASELQQYFASNPTTVWYELKYPQIQPDIVLPNGVHDEYNPETGVHTKRVGFAELDGSADEKLDSVIYNHNKENTVVFFAYGYTPLAKKYVDKGKGYPIYTNQFEYVDVDLGQTSGGGVSMDVEGAYMAFDGNVCFAISKKTLEPFGFTNDMNTKTQVIPIISKYLSQNPLKVWYELQTPITYQLTPYFGLPQPYAYEDGYLIHDSAYPETTLPPEFKYKLVANRTGQVMQNSRKLQEHTTRLSNLEALIIEATIESLFNRELQLFELELMDVQLIDLGE